ncbi:hypothetical protein [Rhizobium leguminosarum]
MARMKEKMMTTDEIQELFIRAAEVDRKMPNTARPARLKAMNMGYVHTFSEMNGWDEAEKHAANWAWLDPKNLLATKNDIGIWYAAMEVIKLVPSEKNRRSLWAWARTQAGVGTFSRWCSRVEGISRQLGDYRRNAAIECILAAFSRKPLQHNENVEDDDFTKEPETGDKRDTIRVFRSEEAKPSAFHFDSDLINCFDWAEKQNERRRQRETERRKRQAA